MPSEHERRDVYITSCGAYLPGPPITNDEMEAFLGRGSGKSSTVKQRILKSNGIKTRHYALSSDGHTVELNEQLAAEAVKRALAARDMPLSRVEMLALGTTLGDALIPGFASMVQGRLGGPPMEVLSAGGVCCSGMSALQAAYRALRCGERRVAVAGGSELVSRSLRASKMKPERVDGQLDFDTEFLRWMLSDGAGVVLLEHEPRPTGLSLRIDWIDFVSRAGESVPCMHAGLADPNHVTAGATWLDFPTFAEAEQRGLLRVRQDIRMLDRMVEVGVEHWLRLVRCERLIPDQIDHVICHYSSQFFRERIMSALAHAGLMPARGKWFSNLERTGNTGAASVFIALEELVASGELKVGERIILAVPESARFSSCCAQLTVVDASARPAASMPPATGPAGHVGPRSLHQPAPSGSARAVPLLAFPTDSVLPVSHARSARHQRLLVDLGLAWTEFNGLLHEVPFLRRIELRAATLADYRNFLRHLRQQVVEGSRWIARAASNISVELAWLRSMLLQHAVEEHRDYELLDRDYVASGGRIEDIQGTPMNLGSEALSAFILQRASLADPVDLAGAMFIIEGLGLRVAAKVADRLSEQLGLQEEQLSFLRYHASRDVNHFARLDELLSRLPLDDALCARTVRTARTTGRLYVLQLEELEHG